MRTLRTIAAVVLSLALLCGTAFAKGGGGFGGGSSGSFGGGSRGFSAPSTSFSAPSSKGFSAPSAITVAPKVSAPPPPPPSITPSRPVQFDSSATRARAAEESRSNFRANSPEAPKPPPTSTSTWNDRPIFPTRQADPPRTNTTSTSWAPSTRTVVVERQVTTGGGTDMWFWLWLMEHNNQRQRDEWVYHNRDRVSQEQMNELRRRDSSIDDRLRKLETDGVKRDPEFRIPDSEYKDKTVTAPAETSATSSGFKTFWLTIGFILLFGAFVYLVFFKKFPSRRFA